MSDCEGTGLSYAGVGASLSPPAPVSSPEVLDHCCVTLIHTKTLFSSLVKHDAQETTEK